MIGTTSRIPRIAAFLIVAAVIARVTESMDNQNNEKTTNYKFLFTGVLLKYDSQASL